MKFFLAVVCCLMASINGQLPDGNCTQTQVDDSENFCSDCLTVYGCRTVDEAPVEIATCSTGEVCGTVGSVIGCSAVTDDSPCACDSLVCDYYDPDVLNICVPSFGILDIDPCENQTCEDGACADFPVTTTAGPTTTTEAPTCDADTPTGMFVPVTPECKTGYYCISEGSEPIQHPSTCGDGEYFDADESGCLTLPPDNCANCEDSQCPDKLDCSMYVICENGVEIEVNECTDDTPYYDATNNLCSADNSTCDITTTCEFDDLPTTASEAASDSTDSSAVSDSSESPDTTDSSESPDTTDSSESPDTTDSSESPVTTDSTGSSEDTTAETATTMPETCSEDNVNVNYEYEGDCKKYWGCREITPDTYAYIEYTCLSILVFNPETGACDLAENVDGCD